jgi:excisionase family DNA binding protein
MTTDTDDHGADLNADETIDDQAAALLLHCSVSQVRQLCQAGELPAIQYGRGWLFVRADLLAFVAAEARNRAQALRSRGRPAPGRPTARIAPAAGDGKASRRKARPQLEAVGS